jgi:hypothetical protein
VFFFLLGSASSRRLAFLDGPAWFFASPFSPLLTRFLLLDFSVAITVSFSERGGIIGVAGVGHGCRY